MTMKVDLVNCVKDLYSMGYTSPVSGNHSIRIKSTSWMLITPSGIPRYEMKEKDLVKVNLDTEKIVGFRKPSIEWHMHASIYKRISTINAIIHTHSPYTLGIAISAEKFPHIIEEAKIVVGDPVVIANRPSGSLALANKVSGIFESEENVRAIIVRNHGVVTVGKDIYQARAVVEALEEWAKILTVSKIFGGPKYKL
jgi:ribulose-5-phosphate 4-epimerase/fuculose-1-phosphate aldolase